MNEKGPGPGMYHLTIPFTGLQLALSPRWGEAPGLLAIAIWVCLALVPLALILWLARYELRLVSRPVGIFLLALRVIVLVLVWNLVFLQPVLAYPAAPKVRERVLVAVDVSGSMGVTDPQRTAAEKLRIVRALHLGRDLCPDLLLDQWLDQYAAGDTPQWVAADEYRDQPERRRQLEAERRRLHEALCKRVDDLSRGRLARLALTDDGAGLLRALAERYDLELLGFAGDAFDVRPDQLNLLDHPPEGRHNEFTDLNIPLARGLDRGGPVRGVILLTDGQHNPAPGGQPTAPVALAEQLAQRQVPVYAVGLGAAPVGADHRAPPPPDVAVAAVRAPDAVLRPRSSDPEQAATTNVDVQATVRINGLPAQDVPVELLRDGKRLQQKVIHHDGHDRDYPVTFAASLTKEGTEQLTVRVPPVPGEGHPGNNSRSVSVKVVEDTADVLLIDGEGRWEYHYLATALARDPLVRKLDRVLFEQPRIQRASDAELDKAGYPSRSLPGKDPGLAPYDCIVLGDVSPEQLPLDERKQLEDYVANRGGTLVIVAGKRAMPLAFPTGGAEPDPLTKLLPVEKVHVVAPRDGFPLTLTDEGQQTPLLQMEDNPFLQTQADLLAGRGEHQHHYWAAAGRIKPGATALAYHAGEAANLDAAARKKLREEEVILARQTYGRGRVLYVGLDTTWRWRYKVGDRLHHHFWGLLVRWAAADKLVEGGNAQVHFGATRANYGPGEEVRLLVRVDEKLPAPGKDAVRLRVLRRQGGNEEVVAVVPLERREAQPRVLDGTVRDLPAGEYRLELDAADLPKEELREARFTVTAPESKEMAELATDWDLLERLASVSGGRALGVEGTPELAKLLTKKDVAEDKRPEYRLWEWWPTLVLLLLLLTLEWGGRKLAGLP